MEKAAREDAADSVKSGGESVGDGDIGRRHDNEGQIQHLQCAGVTECRIWCEILATKHGLG